MSDKKTEYVLDIILKSFALVFCLISFIKGVISGFTPNANNAYNFESILLMCANTSITSVVDAGNQLKKFDKDLYGKSVFRLNQFSLTISLICIVIANAIPANIVTAIICTTCCCIYFFKLAFCIYKLQYALKKEYGYTKEDAGNDTK